MLANAQCMLWSIYPSCPTIPSGFIETRLVSVVTWLHELWGWWWIVICSQYQKLFLLTTEWLTWLLRSSGDSGYGKFILVFEATCISNLSPNHLYLATDNPQNICQGVTTTTDFKSMILLIKACDSLPVVTKSAQPWLLKVHAFVC